jgi:hypothetical protein
MPTLLAVRSLLVGCEPCGDPCGEVLVRHWDLTVQKSGQPDRAWSVARKGGRRDVARLSRQAATLARGLWTWWAMPPGSGVIPQESRQSFIHRSMPSLAEVALAGPLPAGTAQVRDHQVVIDRRPARRPSCPSGTATAPDRRLPLHLRHRHRLVFSKPPNSECDDALISCLAARRHQTGFKSENHFSYPRNHRGFAACGNPVPQ